MMLLFERVSAVVLPKIGASVKSSILPVSGLEYPDSGKVGTPVTENCLFKAPVREVVEIEAESSTHVSPSFENVSEQSSHFLG